MKRIILATGVLTALMTTGCKNQQTVEKNNTEQQEIMTVKGKVVEIENGKDGYMATIQDTKGINYIATISMVNLQKSGGIFKRFNVEDKVSVSGPFWKDADGIVHITATKIN